MSPQEILDAARLSADVLLKLVPHDHARQLLDEAAIRRANQMADIAEAVKFGGGE